MTVTLGEIAEFLGARLQGDAAYPIEGVAELKSATPSFLSFMVSQKYAAQLQTSKAGAFLISEADSKSAPSQNLIISSNPHRDFARVLTKFFDKRSHPQPGIHPAASVHSGARLGKDARVGAFCVVEDGAVIGERVVLYPFSYVGPKTLLGDDCLLYPSTVVMEGCRLGNRVILQAGAVVGSDGFGFVPDPPRGYIKIPQIGIVIVEDDVEIQANACVDRAALDTTIIGKGSKLDNLVHIAHNVKIGQHTALAGQTGIAGSSVVGNWVTSGGQAAISGHLKIGDQAVITGQSAAAKDVPTKTMVSGSPAQPTMQHQRGMAEVNRLPELRKRVKNLEARLAELEKNRAPEI